MKKWSIEVCLFFRVHRSNKRAQCSIQFIWISKLERQRIFQLWKLRFSLYGLGRPVKSYHECRFIALPKHLNVSRVYKKFVNLHNHPILRQQK